MTKTSIREWLNKAKKQIDMLDAELILLEVLGVDDRSRLILRENTDLSSAELKKANQFLARRENDEPLAYILGCKEFYGRKFAVDSSVLIPRPETEVIIDYVLGKCTDDKERVAGGNNSNAVSNLCEKSQNWQIFDIGTGSGCIAITLGIELEKRKIKADIYASDISESALEKAKENAKNLHVDQKIKFTQSNLLNDLKFKTDRPSIVVANLPYVSEHWDWIDKKQLGFEPKKALYADQDGLALIFELIEQFVEKFKSGSGATLVVESDDSQQRAIVDYAKKFSLRIELISDFVMAFEYS